MRIVLDAARFLSRTARELRQGALSREQMRLLRFGWKEDEVECDWLIRPADPWDVDLPPHVAKENQTLQALKDALGLRDLIFESFPQVMNANLRMFRTDADLRLELMMRGSVTRSNEAFDRVASVAMRAKLCGFQFTLDDGVLAGLVST